MDKENGIWRRTGAQQIITHVATPGELEDDDGTECLRKSYEYETVLCVNIYIIVQGYRTARHKPTTLTSFLV